MPGLVRGQDIGGSVVVDRAYQVGWIGALGQDQQLDLPLGRLADRILDGPECLRRLI